MQTMQQPSTSYERVIRRALGKTSERAQESTTLPNIVEWAEKNFYIIETRQPIVLQPHQRDILRIFTEQKPDGSFKWTTLMYSTIKKSGKTTISALYARWAAECWGEFQEIYNLGNKLQQAQGRAFRKITQSLTMLNVPQEHRSQWDVQKTILTHKPSGSFIQALPISDKGESGGNPSLTVWTELWGFEHEDARRFWDELQPVATRKLSQRFIDTYAGYTGESELLQDIWNLAKSGEPLHDSLPLYGVESAGICAYIDTGVEARRMAWQTPDYYQQQELIERPSNFSRLHLNEWVEPETGFLEVAEWDALAYAEKPKTIGRVVIGVDASVSGDSTAAVAVCLDGNNVFELETWIFEPPKNGKIDYETTLKPALVDMLRRYRTWAVVYDEYQMHDFMTQFGKLHRGPEYVAFGQGSPRIDSDTALLKRIQQGQLKHSGNDKLRQHIQNANAKEIGDGKAIRIVKRSPEKKIDAVICLSMASYVLADKARRGKGGGMY